jgi:lysozyme
MKISKRGLDLIASFEGLRLKAYVCPAGILTIGYGHTGDVKEGDIITEEKAKELLAKDVERFENAVIVAVNVQMTPAMLDALVSFTYNVGEGNLRRSTLLKRLNAKDYIGAANEFLKWNKGGGKILPGLVKRRETERELFLSEPYPEPRGLDYVR